MNVLPVCDPFETSSECALLLMRLQSPYALWFLYRRVVLCSRPCREIVHRLQAMIRVSVPSVTRCVVTRCMVCVMGSHSLELTRGDLQWHRMLFWLLARHIQTEWAIAVLSTLGGAHAALGQARHAKRFAQQQLALARAAGNSRLAFVSQAYQCYYFIHIGRLDRVRGSLDRLRSAEVLGHCRICQRVYDACELRLNLALQRRPQQQQQQQQQQHQEQQKQ